MSVTRPVSPQLTSPSFTLHKKSKANLSWTTRVSPGSSEGSPVCLARCFERSPVSGGFSRGVRTRPRLHQTFCHTLQSSYCSTSFVRERRIEMIRVPSSRIVKIADQCLSPMRPITIRRGSPCVRAGSWRRSGSSHNAWPSTNSMPCFALFACQVLLKLPRRHGLRRRDVSQSCLPGLQDRNESASSARTAPKSQSNVQDEERCLR